MVYSIVLASLGRSALCREHPQPVNMGLEDLWWALSVYAPIIHTWSRGRFYPFLHRPEALGSSHGCTHVNSVFIEHFTHPGFSLLPTKSCWRDNAVYFWGVQVSSRWTQTTLHNPEYNKFSLLVLRAYGCSIHHTTCRM